MDIAQHICAVTFDVGGTLIEPWPSVGHVYGEVASAFGIEQADPAVLNREFRAAWKGTGPGDYSRNAWRRHVEMTFAAAGLSRPTEDCFGAIYDRFAEPTAWRIFEDVLPALEALRARGLKLGTISNWDERLRPLLDALGLGNYFSVQTISCEAGCTKPDRSIFLRAAQELECKPATILHLGDREREDVEGATSAGFQAVLLDRGRKGAAKPPGMGRFIGSLEGLADILERAAC